MPILQRKTGGKKQKVRNRKINQKKKKDGKTKPQEEKVPDP